MTDKYIGSFHVPHKGPEEYVNVWQKIRSIWFYVHKHYHDSYKYFYICDNDTYLVVDNVREYLVGEKVEKLLNALVTDLTNMTKCHLI